MGVLTFPEPGEKREQATRCANQPCENDAFWWDMPHMRGGVVRSSTIILCEEHAKLYTGLVRIDDLNAYERGLDAQERKQESLTTLADIYLYIYEEGVEELGIDTRDLEYVHCTPDYVLSREGYWHFMMIFHMKDGRNGTKRFGIKRAILRDW